MTLFLIGLAIAIIILLIFRDKDIIPICVGILTFFSILSLDNMFINYATSDMVSDKKLMTFILWIVVLFVSVGFSVFISFIFGIIASAFVDTFKFKKRKK